MSPTLPKFTIALPRLKCCSSLSRCTCRVVLPPRLFARRPPASSTCWSCAPAAAAPSPPASPPSRRATNKQFSLFNKPLKSPASQQELAALLAGCGDGGVGPAMAAAECGAANANLPGSASTPDLDRLPSSAGLAASLSTTMQVRWPASLRADYTCATDSASRGRASFGPAWRLARPAGHCWVSAGSCGVE